MTRVSTKTKAKTEALYIEKLRAEADAKEITHMAKAAIKAKAKVKAGVIDRTRTRSEAR